MSKLIIARKFSDKQNKERIALLGLTTDDEGGGVARFEGVDCNALKKLVSKGYADPEDKQNDAPTLGSILEFMKRFPEFKAMGYIVSNDRSDRRITVDGLEGDTTDEVAIMDFKDYCDGADEFECENGHCRAWWD